MRTFYEEWSYLDKSEQVILDADDCNLAPAGSKLENSNWNLLVPKQIDYPESSFCDIGFSHHRMILTKVKDTNERIFYIRRCASEKYSREELTESIARDDYHHQGNLPNNFIQTLPAAEQAFCAINTFKDEYLLDYINVEELGIRDKQDVDERVVENTIIHNVKNFIIKIARIPLSSAGSGMNR